MKNCAFSDELLTTEIKMITIAGRYVYNNIWSHSTQVWYIFEPFEHPFFQFEDYLTLIFYSRSRFLKRCRKQG